MEKEDYPETPVEITDSDFDTIVKKYPVVIVDFWAPWCLAPETRILTKNPGLTLLSQLESSWKGKEILSPSKDGLITTRVVGYYRILAPHAIKITTESGRTIISTDEHLFYTDKGWKKAGSVTSRDMVAILLDFPEERKKSSDKRVILREEMIKESASKRMRIRIYLKQLKERDLLPLRLDNKKTLILARLLGYSITDGSLSSCKNNERLVEFFTGTKKDAENIQKDLESLGYCSSLRFSSRNRNIYGRDVRQSAYRVRSCKTSLFLLFKALGAPSGDKTVVDYAIPSWIIDGPRNVQREFLSGFLGGDGTTPIIHVRKRERRKAYNRVHINPIEFHKREDLLESGLNLASQITELLKNFGVKVKEIKHEREGYKRKDGLRSIKFKIVLYTSFENVFNYSSIGFSYSQMKNRSARIINEFLKIRLRKKQRRIEQRKKAIELRKKGYTIKKIADTLCLSKAVVTNWLIKGCSAFPPQDSLLFDDWMSKRTKNLPDGLLWEKVEKVQKIFPSERKWMEMIGIQLDKAHTYVANGFLTHNCPPCKILGPIIDSIAKKYAGRIVFAKLNVDENKEMPVKYEVMSVPTLLVFKNGKLIDRIIGAMPESALESRIKEYI
jgi:thioredoxin